MMSQRSVIPEPAVPGAPSYHPFPHMGDWIWRPIAQTAFSGGRQVAAYALNAYGPPTLDAVEIEDRVLARRQLYSSVVYCPS